MQFNENDESQWYLSANGKKKGPISSASLKEMADSGILSREALLWKDGMDSWIPAGSFFSLFSGPPSLPNQSSFSPVKSLKKDFFVNKKSWSKKEQYTFVEGDYISEEVFSFINEKIKGKIQNDELVYVAFDVMNPNKTPFFLMTKTHFYSENVSIPVGQVKKIISGSAGLFLKVDGKNVKLSSHKWSVNLKKNFIKNAEKKLFEIFPQRLDKLKRETRNKRILLATFCVVLFIVSSYLDMKKLDNSHRSGKKSYKQKRNSRFWKNLSRNKTKKRNHKIVLGPIKSVKSILVKPGLTRRDILRLLKSSRKDSRIYDREDLCVPIGIKTLMGTTLLYIPDYTKKFPKKAHEVYTYFHRIGARIAKVGNEKELEFLTRKKFKLSKKRFDNLYQKALIYYKMAPVDCK